MGRDWWQSECEREREREEGWMGVATTQMSKRISINARARELLRVIEATKNVKKNAFFREEDPSIPLNFSLVFSTSTRASMYLLSVSPFYLTEGGGG